MSEIPDYLRPFVMSPSELGPERAGQVDMYTPGGHGPFPAVLIVHGGPIPADLRPTPRDWPVYRGYGALLASRGVIAATVDHRLHLVPGPDGVLFDYATAAADVAAAVEAVRADPHVDGDRVVLWFFSGGGLLSTDWLRTRLTWLRGLALTYPVLAPLPGWRVDSRFQPAVAIRERGTIMPPIVLTRVGLERAEVADTVAQFLTAAADSDVSVEIIDVPNGRHGFDMVDHTDESRLAVERTVARVLELLT